MKKSLFAVVLLAGLFAVCNLGASTVVPADSGFDVATLEPLQLMGLQTPAWMTTSLKPVPNPHPDFPLTCSNYNSNYCSYHYPGTGCCCVAYWTAPGAYCGNICV